MPATCHQSRRSVNAKTDAAARRAAFGVALPAWYRRHRRELPWRGCRDPYRIWVSEIMLQQTRVEVVRAYYRRWLRAFPTWPALARASATRVLKLWEGLGYYQRARNLHAAARHLAGAGRRHLPRTSADWQTLPGIGRYTAAAIASIAAGERVPVVDGNVARVLARVLAIREDVTTAAARGRLFAVADGLMPRRVAPGTFNQAMMELGALVCTPARPRCEACPLAPVCRARACGLTGALPNRGAARPVRRVTVAAGVVWRRGRILVRRRGAGGQLAGLWELPGLPDARLRAGPELDRVAYTITRRRISLQVRAATWRGTPPRPGATWRWIDQRDLHRLAFPAGQRRALERAFAAAATPSRLSAK